jgi:hypothetical protein
MTPLGNVVIIITKSHKSCIFSFHNLEATKDTLKAHPILECSLKFGLNTNYHDNFQLCLKPAASLFPFSCVIFYIFGKKSYTVTPTNTAMGSTAHRHTVASLFATVNSTTVNKLMKGWELGKFSIKVSVTLTKWLDTNDCYNGFV